MLALILLTLAQAPGASDSRVLRVERVPFGRYEGARGGVMSYAFFEAFPASGAGTFGACSTTPPTGARGEALTFARASTATCTKTATGGLITTGIANGDLVTLSSGQPRVEYDSNGVLGLLVESAGGNLLPRFIEYADVLWTDVGTPTLTGSQTSPFAGALASSAVQFDDNDGAAYEGRSQTITVTAATAYLLSCYVKAGTLTSARISLDGTAANITGLSSTTWSIVEVADASSSGVAIAVQVLNGAATSDTGTVIWGGCNVEARTYRTSIAPTTSAAVTRVVESASFDGLSLSTAAGVSWAATVQHPSGNGGGVWAAGANLVADAANRTQLYRANTNVQQCDIFSTSGSRSVGTVIAAYVAGQVYRQACSYSGAGAASTISNYRDGVLISTSAGGLTSAFTIVSVLPGALGAASTTAPADGIVSRICLSPDPTRCR